MNIQFNTSDRHNGTIKPVKSSTGKHAGKWVCRIHGPGLSSKCKTVYSAPYIGAAKAAIAKYLNITVSEVVEVVPTSCATQGGGTAAAVHHEEFDDGNDEDFANFDLNAAVTSAKKQQTPPKHQEKISSSSSNKNVSNNPYHSTPTNLNLGAYAVKGGTLGSTANTSKQVKQSSIKPPYYPKPSTKPSPKDVSTSSATTIQINLSEYKVLQKQAEALREEKESLQKEITSAKQEKKELEKEAIFTRTQNEMLKKETTSLKNLVDKMKGESCTKKSELKSAKAELEKYEKEACIAHEEKGRYEKEAKTIKAELDSLKKQSVTMKAELDSLKKQSATRAKSTGEDEPPTKKQKTVKQAGKGMTVIKSMKVSDLKDEAAARGVDTTGMNKGRLLEVLGVGSALIVKTEAWRQIVLLRAKFENERQVAEEKRRAAEELENERQHQLYLKQQKEARECQLKREKEEQEKRKKVRAAEIISQREQHVHRYPTVHGCKLAKTSELMMHGTTRTYNRINCDDCRNFIWSNDAKFTCEECDFDICQDCFKEKTMTPEEKKAEAKMKADLEKERREREAEERRLQKEEEAKRMAKWDPKKQFKSSIIEPTDKNVDPDGNKMKGYTVWCSDGYGNDGWHSYEGPPDKEFDSTYKTKDDANERARYLFYWKNPWGQTAQEILEGGYCGGEDHHKSMKNGLVTYEDTPDDSTTWTVAVVPDAAFAYLENARNRRHSHDREYGGNCYGVANRFLF